MYSIIPEAWNIQACKCHRGTVARADATDTVEYSRVLHNVCMTGELTQCVTCKVY